MGHIAIYRMEPQLPIELRIHFHSERFGPSCCLSSNRFNCCSSTCSFFLSAGQQTVEMGGLSHFSSPYVITWLRISTMT